MKAPRVQRWLAVMCLIGASVYASARALPARGQPAPATGQVVVQVLGVADAEGQVLVALHRSPASFPDHAERAYGRRAVKARAGSIEVVFDGVPPGPFAVSAFHDSDRDFELDTGLFGIPQEDYGFSRDARKPFGPPDFAAARLTLRPGEHMRVRVRVH